MTDKPLTTEQQHAIDQVMALFDQDANRICEAMGMEWDGNMGWQG